MAQQQIRQGDVYVVPVDAIPDDCVPVPQTVKGRNVLAFGEFTGHHHSVAVADSELVRNAEGVFLRIMAPTPLQHQEHAEITLAPGAYRVVRQREYVPDALPAYVAD